MLILGEFASGKELLAAARALREAGHAGLDVHSPYPLAGTAEQSLDSGDRLRKRSRSPTLGRIEGRFVLILRGINRDFLPFLRFVLRGPPRGGVRPC